MDEDEAVTALAEALDAAVVALGKAPLAHGRARSFFLFEAEISLEGAQRSQKKLLLAVSRREIGRRPLVNALASKARDSGDWKELKRLGAEGCLKRFLKPKSYLYGSVQRLEDQVTVLEISEVKGPLGKLATRRTFKNELYREIPGLRKWIGPKANLKITRAGGTEVDTEEDDAESSALTDLEAEEIDLERLTPAQRHAHEDREALLEVLFEAGALISDEEKAQEELGGLIDSLRAAELRQPRDESAIRLMRQALVTASFAGPSTKLGTGDKVPSEVANCLVAMNQAAVGHLRRSVSRVRSRMEALDREVAALTDAERQARQPELLERLEGLWQAHGALHAEFQTLTSRQD